MSTSPAVRKSKVPKFKPEHVEHVRSELDAMAKIYGFELVRWVWNRAVLERRIREKLERQKASADRQLADLNRRFGR